MILTYPHSILFEPTVEVTEFDKSLQELVDELRCLVTDNLLASLAANCIGRTERVFVINAHLWYPPLDRPPVEFVNPRIELSGHEIQWEEGCVTMPGLYKIKDRISEVRINAWTVDGRPFCKHVRNILKAVILQHEMDHLDGVIW